jgi:hypothetical protein
MSAADYGENSGDSVHGELHFGTSCHYQIFFGPEQEFVEDQ